MTCNEPRQVHTAEMNKNQLYLSKIVTNVYNANTWENHPLTCNECRQDLYVEKKKKGKLSKKRNERIQCKYIGKTSHDM